MRVDDLTLDELARIIHYCEQQLEKTRSADRIGRLQRKRAKLMAELDRRLA